MRIRVYKFSNTQVAVRYDDELQVALMQRQWVKDEDFIQMVVDLREIYGFDEVTEEQLADLTVVRDEEVK